jgi:hypothetical protein
MKSILEALKIAIRDGMPEIKGVHIVPDPDMLPSAVRYPCVGLKDGDQTFSEGMDQTETETGSVMIYIYQQILKEEASMMGDGSNKGVLDLMEDLRNLLNWNLMEDIIQHAYIPDAITSETMFAGENVFVQRKGCKFNYES